MMETNLILFVVIALLVVAVVVAVGYVIYLKRRPTQTAPLEPQHDKNTQVLKEQVADLRQAVRQTQELAEAKRRADLIDLERSKDLQIDELKRRLDMSQHMKSELSVKLLGESLEQHCETSFNQLRATAFRNAQFGKDNDISQGSKGDYIYREFDDSGVEIVSIMFEMKNEAENSKNTQTNEHHLKKLDADRVKKGCDYAVLVSTLEPNSEYYNTGIVDVSHLYPKMYVVRPQFFIPIISLLRNAAMDSLAIKQELQRVLQSQPEVTDFEAKLDDLKGRVSRNNINTQKKCDSAVDEINKTIRKLTRIREDIESIGKYTSSANSKLDDITIRRLTYKNPVMKEKFAEASALETNGVTATNAINAQE